MRYQTRTSECAWVIAVSCANVCAGAELWNQFRGPNGSGVSVEGRIPAEFSPDKNVEWKLDLPPGKSSPVVAGDGDAIFLTAHEGDKLLTLAVDAQSGKRLWRGEVARTRTQHRTALNDAAAPTPVTDGKNVYAFFADFGFVAYNGAGKELWRLETSLHPSMHGHSSSPVLIEGTLILVADQEKESFLIGIDAGSGKPRWRTKRPASDAGAYTSPVPYHPLNGAPQAVVAGDMEIAGYSAATGEKLWWVQGLPFQPKASPTVSRGVIYYAVPTLFEGLPSFAAMLANDKNGDGKVASDELPPGPFRDSFKSVDTNSDGFWDEQEWRAFYSMGTVKGQILALRPEGAGDLTSKAMLWTADKGLPGVPTPVVYDGSVYMVRSGGILTAVNAASGVVNKQGRLEGALGAYYASPVAAGGRVLAINQEGKAAVIRAGEQWELIAVNDLREDCWATPAMAGGRLIVRTARALYSFAEPKR